MFELLAEDSSQSPGLTGYCFYYLQRYALVLAVLICLACGYFIVKWMLGADERALSADLETTFHDWIEAAESVEMGDYSAAIAVTKKIQARALYKSNPNVIDQKTVDKLLADYCQQLNPDVESSYNKMLDQYLNKKLSIIDLKLFETKFGPYTKNHLDDIYEKRVELANTKATSSSEVPLNNTVKELLAAARQPFDFEVERKYLALLDQYAKGQVEILDIKEFTKELRPYTRAQLDTIYRDCVDDIDKARSKFASRLFRLQVNVRSINSTYANPRPDISELIRKKIVENFQAPKHHKVTYGKPAGKREAMNTIISCNATIYLHSKCYYAHPKDGLMVSRSCDDRFKSEEIVHKITLTLFNPKQDIRMRNLRLTHNWEPYTDNYIIVEIPLPESFDIPINSSSEVRKEIMSEIHLDINKQLVKAIEDFQLPILDIDNL